MKKLNPHRPHGFSLLELMVVVLIIGIFSSFVWIHGLSRHTERETRDFAEQLKNLIQSAHEQSLSQINTLGLMITPHGYEFYRYMPDQGETWAPLRNTDNFWKRQPVPDFIRIRLKVLKSVRLEGDHLKDPPPQIVFMPDGNFTAFEIWIIDTGHPGGIKISGQPENGITLQVVR